MATMHAASESSCMRRLFRADLSDEYPFSMNDGILAFDVFITIQHGKGQEALWARGS
jgi:hypothetical protein